MFTATPHSQPPHPPHPNKKTSRSIFDQRSPFGHSLGFPRIFMGTFEGNKGFFVTTYQNTPKPQQIRPFSPPSRILFDLVCFKIST